MSRNVLIICYYFPPLGMGGIGRPLNLYTGLQKHGWNPYILTVKPVAYRAYEPELLDSLDQTRIFRSGSIDPQRLLYMLGVRKVAASTISAARSLSDRYFPDSKIGWVRSAVRLGRVLCENYEIERIISTAPPVSCHLVGRKLSQEFSVPWIADFRDYWTAYPIEQSYSKSKMIKRGNRLLGDIQKDASEITSVNDVIADYLKSNVVIRNGYNSKLSEKWHAPTEHEKFTIGLLGHQLESFEVETLIRLLKLLSKRSPENCTKIRIMQVGQLDKKLFERQLSDNGLSIEVIYYGQQSREKTIELLSQTHMFYFGVNVEGNADFLPGKTFDLIASGRPIIVRAPERGEVWKVLNGSGMAHFVNIEKIDYTLEYFLSLISCFQDRNLEIKPLPDYARQYSSDEMVRKFAELLDKLT